MKSNFSRLFSIALLLLFISGSIGLGYYLYAKYFQIRQAQQARDLLKQQKYSAAIAAYDRLLQTDIAQPHLLWVNRGYGWRGLNQYKNMLQDCTKATSIEPQAALGWNCRGEARYLLNQKKVALKNFDRAIALQPENAVFWLNKSKVSIELQQYKSAIVASEQAIELLSKVKFKKSTDRRYLAIALARQGKGLLETKQNSKALLAFNQSLEYAPDYLAAQQGAGIALYRTGAYSKAVKVFSEILQRDDLTTEQQAISSLYQGISLCQTPKNAAAQQAFEQVVKLTKDPQALAIAKSGCGIR